jgi:hypothetical protein
MMLPGDIVRVAGFQKIHDLYGYPWYFTDAKETVKGDRKLSQHDFYQLSQKLFHEKELLQFVCVPGKDRGHPLVSFKGYEQSLLDFYYEKDGGIRKECVPIVMARWREFTKAPDEFEVFPAPRFVPPMKKTFWVIVEKKGRWKMPVLASHYCRALDDGARWLFCPSAPVHLTEYLCPSCYCTNLKQLPVRFSALIASKNVRQCTILQHGFLQPEFWHYKFWKHPVAGTETAEHKEKEKWESVLSSPIPSASLFTAEGCRERVVDRKKSKGHCEPCVLNQFKKVHAKAGVALCEYLESGVTFLAEAKTIEIRWNESDEEAVLVKIAAKAPHDSAFYRFLMLRGVCYDWDAPCPTLYLYPWTYYFRHSSKPLWTYESSSEDAPESQWLEGRIENVTQPRL